MIRKPYISLLFCLLILTIQSCSTTKEEKSSTPIATQDSENEALIDTLIKSMTLEEKVGMIHANSSFTSGGVPRLGIPELVMSDGPNGIRKEHGRDWMPDLDADDSATYLPTGIGLAATWNTELGYAFGKTLAEEAKFRGKDVILGPGINIFRTPLNGRNYEYLGEDPYLTSKMAVGYIKGVQDQGISACVKHYLANNQETNRNIIDVQMSERALREIYLPGFAAAVREADVNTVMGAYNKFRGQWATHNEYLINKILKEELGFRGAVISDWGAVHHTMEAVNNGCDIEMGSEFVLSTPDKPDYKKFFMADTLVKLVKAGMVNESIIDDKIRRILRIMIKTDVLNKNVRTPGSFNTKEHQATALKVAEESITLLKNENVLPFKKDQIKTIAIIGANADWKHAGAGGSGQVNAKYEITALKGIQNYLGKSAMVKYAKGYEIKKGKKADSKLISEALNIAKGADQVVFVGGWIHGYSDEWNENVYDAENVDKTDMKLPFGQDQLINSLLKANPNIVIVFYGGGPVEMGGFAEKSKAIIQAWYPGMEGGTALARILFGEVSPSGKLPITFPKKLQDSPAHKLGEFPGDGVTVKYYEGIYVGYRYFDSKHIEPQFPFGFGLSYTTFEFSDIKTQKGKDGVIVTVKVKNSGKVDGSEVVQAYVKDEKAAVDRPEKELKGFSKIYLKAGETQEVTISMNMDAFKYYDEAKKQWVLEPGKFTILLGNSSRDIRLNADIEL